MLVVIEGIEKSSPELFRGNATQVEAWLRKNLSAKDLAMVLQANNLTEVLQGMETDSKSNCLVASSDPIIAVRRLHT